MGFLFSIIIPNFNSFHNMNKCLQSLEEQTCKDFEVIVIDDASTDDSYERLINWSKETIISNKIIKQTVNAGPGVARNVGMDYCEGRYIIFIDADDFVETAMIEKLTPFADGRYDTIVFDALHEKNCSTLYMAMIESTLNFHAEVSNRNAFVYIRGCPWGKAFRADFIKRNDIKFGEYYCSEDIPFTKSAVALSKRIYYLNEAMYHYVDVNTSIMNSGIGKWNSENEENTEKIIEWYLRDKGFDAELEAWRLRAIYPRCIFNMIHSLSPISEVKTYINVRYSATSIKNNKYIKHYPLSRRLLIYVLASHNMILVKIIYKIFAKNGK